MSIISEALDKAVNKLVDAMTSFSNEIGADNGDALNNLYVQFGLSATPTEVEFNTLATKEKVTYRAAEKVMENRAINMNDLYEAILAIDSGTGPFNTANAVKTWATDNMGTVGVDIASNIDVFLALRVKFAPLISAAEMNNHAATVRAFRDELDARRRAGEIKV